MKTECKSCKAGLGDDIPSHDENDDTGMCWKCQDKMVARPIYVNVSSGTQDEIDVLLEQVRKYHDFLILNVEPSESDSTIDFYLNCGSCLDKHFKCDCDEIFDKVCYDREIVRSFKHD